MLLGFLVVAILILFGGYSTINISQKALQKSIGEGSVKFAAKVLDNIDRAIYSGIERWESYALTNPRLKKAVLSSNQEFGKLSNIQGYINKRDEEWVSAPKEELTPFMQEIINNELSQRLRKRAGFYQKEYGYRVYPEMYVTNKYGVVIASTGRTSDYLQADEEWYQKAVAEKECWVGEVEYDESSDCYAMDIVINLYDEAGNLAGIFKSILNIEEVINIIKELQSSLAHQETAKVDFHLVNKEGKIIFALGEKKQYKIFKDISDTNFFNETKSGIEYFLAKGDHPGEGEKLFAHALSKGYRHYKGLGWILIVEHETEEIFAPITKLRNSMLISLLAVAILAILIGFFISRSITKPVSM